MKNNYAAVFVFVALCIAIVCARAEEPLCILHPQQSAQLVYVPRFLFDAYVEAGHEITLQANPAVREEYYRVNQPVRDLRATLMELAGGPEHTVILAPSQCALFFLYRPLAQIVVPVVIPDSYEGLPIDCDIEYDALYVATQVLAAVAPRLVEKAGEDEDVDIIAEVAGALDELSLSYEELRHASFELQVWELARWLADLLFEKAELAHERGDFLPIVEHSDVSSGSEHFTSDDDVRSIASALSHASRTVPLSVAEPRHTVTWLLETKGARALQILVSDGVLDLSSQELESISDLNILHQRNIIDCTTITGVRLSHNHLRSVSRGSFAYFSQLRWLALCDNEYLDEIVAGAFDGCRELRILDIARCHLRFISPTAFRHSAKIEKLLLAHNQLMTLPDLTVISNLRILDCSYNQLREGTNLYKLSRLEVANFEHNAIEFLSAWFFPSPELSGLRYGLFNNNKITKVAPVIADLLAENCFIDLRENPLWLPAHAEGCRDFLKQLEARGFAISRGLAISEGDDCVQSQICKALHEDLRDKVLKYMYGKELLTLPALKSLIKEKRLVAHTNTGVATVGMWFYKHHGLLMMAGALVTGGVSGGAAFMWKAAETVMIDRVKRAAVAAGVGMVAGTFLGNRLGVWINGDDFYCDPGRGTAYMTATYQKQYIGTSRMLALVSLFKQYLVVFTTYLHFYVNYDAYADHDRLLKKLKKRFKRTLHIDANIGLDVESEPAFIHLVYQLMSGDADAELTQYAPADLFVKKTILSEDLGKNATYEYMGQDVVARIRDVIISFAKGAGALRRALHNRYYGKDDVIAVFGTVGLNDDLRAALTGANSWILEPLVSDCDDDITYRYWTDELAHLSKLATKSKELLNALEEQARAAVV